MSLYFFDGDVNYALIEERRNKMAQAPQASPIVSFIPLILIFMVFYFLLIRPQKQKQIEHQNMVSNLKKNDEVITNGGIHGTIVNVKENSVVLRVDDNVKIEVQRGSVATVKKSRQTESK